jgi:hypothetical protein
MPFAFFANVVCPTGAVCRIIFHNKHDFIKTNFALDACFQQEPFRRTISWRVLPERGKLSELERKKIRVLLQSFKSTIK